MEDQLKRFESDNHLLHRDELTSPDVVSHESLQELRNRKQLEREFEKIGREDFGRMVEPFLTKGMFQKHAKR
tara:strand:+ start:606 stop:821 length:216 start_codon:yes stop_codon:yes gene_type:complete